jgi:Ser/Thr protein kinase RdoA (MazF antagonist)
VYVNNIREALCEILGEEPKHVISLDSANNDVVRVNTGSASYILKRYEGNRHRAYEREVGMRECLRRFSRIEFPDIVGDVDLGDSRYVLMEDVAGERLDEIWRQDRTRAGQQMRSLGQMLGALHEIPVAEAKRFLGREEELYAESYVVWMMDTIAPYLRTVDQTSLLRKCYEIIISTPVQEVVIHADFGPHQVVVDAQGKWNLIDFEYAALGAFADDLAGAEVRLEQNQHPNISGFLGGYESVRGASTEYEPVRTAYKAYNLLAILTYRMVHKGEEPPKRETDRLEKLVANL